MSELQILMYVAYAFFFVGTAYRAYQLANMPLHLRWDLYPIPHEKGRADYGGSYYEEVDWWTKPKEVSKSGELKEMAREIIFIHSMFHNNRSLWIFSFPFHFGLYLTIGFILLIFLSAFLGLFGVTVSADSSNFAARALHYITMPFGIVGAILGAFGTLGLFVSRLTKTELLRTSVRSDYFNLILLLAVFVSGLVVWATEDMSYGQLRAFFTDLVGFNSTEPVSVGFTTHMVLAAVFLIYLPFTHMTHFVGKYFTYHKVRWEDDPNLKGGAIEKRVAKVLGFKQTWSAPHIKSGVTWAEAATEESNGSEK